MPTAHRGRGVRGLETGNGTTNETSHLRLAGSTLRQAFLSP